MNTFFVFVSFLAAASAGIVAPIAPIAAPVAAPVAIQKVGYGPSALVRAPAHDSASIESHRLGGNFAYATAEAHAYASITPEISEATHPVAETTYTHQPAPIAHVQPAPIVKTTHAARPVFGQQAIFAQEPVVGPVAHHTTIEQPIFRQRHVSVHQPHAVVQPVAVEAVAPVAVRAAAPVAVEAVAPINALNYAAAPVAAVEAVAPINAFNYAAAAALPAVAAAPAVLA